MSDGTLVYQETLGEDSAETLAEAQAAIRKAEGARFFYSVYGHVPDSGGTVTIADFGGDEHAHDLAQRVCAALESALASYRAKPWEAHELAEFALLK